MRKLATGLNSWQLRHNIMTSYIGYQNIMESASSVGASSSQAGFPVENSFDWLSFDWWKPTSPGTNYITIDAGANVAVDYWAIAFHDLALHSGTIKPQYSSDNFSSDTNDLDSVYTPADNKAHMGIVTQRNVRYYRFEITTSGDAPLIGALSIGARLELPREVPLGFVSPHYGRKNIILNSVSDGGHFIGRSIRRQSREFDIKQRNVPASWFDTYWEDFVEHIEQKPFFYLWDEENRPLESVFAWTDGEVPTPSYGNPNLLDFSIDCRGLVE